MLYEIISLSGKRFISFSDAPTNLTCFMYRIVQNFIRRIKKFQDERQEDEKRQDLCTLCGLCEIKKIMLEFRMLRCWD